VVLSRKDYLLTLVIDAWSLEEEELGEELIDDEQLPSLIPSPS
jgi:hypothetical protein